MYSAGAAVAVGSDRSYRDLEELLAEPGIEVDHVTVYRWVQRSTLLVADAARSISDRMKSRIAVDALGVGWFVVSRMPIVQCEPPRWVRRL